jgi:rhamnosyl/mannosyltransferase
MTTSSGAVTVLHVGKFYPPVSGGMEKVVQVLCEGERDDVDGQVLVANMGRSTVRERVNGVAVTRVGALGKIGAVALCVTFPSWLRRLAGDVIVIHDPNPLALVAHALARPRSRLIVWMHAEVVRPAWRYKLFYRPFLRRALRLADRVVVASPAVAENAAELRDFRAKCLVIPYGIDADQHLMTGECRAHVDRIRRERPEPIALFVGRMVPYKGVDVLLHALVGSRARAVLVGDGPMRSAWQQMAIDLDIADRVRFAGEATAGELQALYNACDLFVLPSTTRAEAFGLVQLEAMACGKPVVSTDLPSGVPWVNQHGETGLVVPPGDSSALRASIDTLAADPALRSRMGERGRARVLAHFTIPRMVEQTTALYRTLLDRPIPQPEHEIAQRRIS